MTSAFPVLAKSLRLPQGFAGSLIVSKLSVKSGNLVMERAVRIARKGLLQLCYRLLGMALRGKILPSNAWTRGKLDCSPRNAAFA